MLTQWIVEAHDRIELLCKDHKILARLRLHVDLARPERCQLAANARGISIRQGDRQHDSAMIFNSVEEGATQEL